ncbi:putative flagellum biosynthesis repressor protein FlbT [Algimonas ampicilliniresistens]|jgi:flagellar protein FlbT|uniref:Flagellum biosynthesis repressor protein FlbT n=1 Tax=Algimonas ampicilliniresistens TaxID=1298735 RepID=A0ABQ5VCD7_9PROT|nr:flagellar biosynthesis repressor FlbT [Algimonas ampicilliniresistens]GLQ24359.1 putative flagellum biosynthesis repressor protein FlbT [Algimonas ampicilliniresistens]
MAGLLISLKPNEKFLVNGALLSNGPKRGQICVEGEGINVLRLSDVIHPDDVRTPVTRLYYAVQTLLSGDAAGDEACDLVEQQFRTLTSVFENTPLSDMLLKSYKAWVDGRTYSSLCRLKPLVPIEAELLGLTSVSDSNVQADMAVAS